MVVSSNSLVEDVDSEAEAVEKQAKGVFVAASSSHGETEDVLEGRASSIAVNPDLLTPMQSLSSCSVHPGAEAATTSAAAGPSSSPFFSTRIQSLGVRRNELGSGSEFEIEASQSHWTETSVATSDFDDEDQRVRDEDQRVRDSVAFEKLKEHPEWGPFFRRQPYELEIGKKIAEGGQAEIFEALGTNKRDVRNLKGKRRLVLKVYKKGFSLEDMQRLWPPGLASAALPYRYFFRYSGEDAVDIYGLCSSVGAQLLDDGRFAFIFDRYWGDFRKLIDLRMLKCNGAPPFSFKETRSILSNIAQGMVMLHKCGLLHKDLKAANVLTLCEDSGQFHFYSALIADFESSVGIVGSGFWRAPEVLRAVKKRQDAMKKRQDTVKKRQDAVKKRKVSGFRRALVVLPAVLRAVKKRKDPSLELEPGTFTPQSDVYSYAMTCYEVLTGRIPFEGHAINDFDLVLRGERPPLPDDIYPAFKVLVRKCWCQDPLRRPSFDEIVAYLLAIPR